MRALDPKTTILTCACSFVMALTLGTPGVAWAEDEAKPPAVSSDELAAGTFKYGLALTLLRFRVTREADQPGRNREYQPELAAVPGPEVGFRVGFSPAARPWRITRSDGTSFQLMSVGVTILAGVGSKASQGNLGTALSLGLLDDKLTVGVGVDLYRGIPVRGSAGDGTATAATGILGWALSPRGEVTPENVFFVIGFGLDDLFGKAHGQEKPAGGSK